MHKDPYAQTIITDANAAYYGVEIADLMEAAGEGIAHTLIKKYGGGKSFAFVCGLGNNGGDGFAAARHLKQAGIPNVKVYLVGRAKELKTEASKKHWQQMKNSHVDYLQDATGKDVEKHDVVVECLLGTGIQGKLYKRFRDVIFRITRLKSNLVAVDVPVPGYRWDLSISMMYPKTEDAIVIDLPIPDYVHRHVGPGEVKLISEPKRHSYKNQNGKVLIIGGSEKYHGAPILAARAAANYAGKVFIYTPSKHQETIDEMTKKSSEYIAVFDDDLHSTIEQVDSIVIGPGLENNYVNEALINKIIADFPDKKYVIDALAIGMTNKNMARRSGNVIFTPHPGEIEMLFDKKVTTKKPEGLLKRFTTENQCYLNLKSSKSMLLGKDGQFKFNETGNQGMAKAGTGDALAGLTAAFAAKNDLWLSMSAAAFVNGIAGELAAKKFGFNYSVEETIDFQPEAIKLARDFGKH